MSHLKYRPLPLHSASEKKVIPFNYDRPVDSVPTQARPMSNRGGIMQADRALLDPIKTFFDLFDWQPADKKTGFVKLI